MKDRSVKPMHILSLSIILCLIACTVSLIVLLIFGVDQSLKSDNSDDGGGEAHGTTLSVTPDYGQSYIDSMIFICDSTFANIKEHGLLFGGSDTRQIWTNAERDLPLEYTVDSATIIFPETNSETLITSAAQTKKPAYIVITIGINNGVPHCSANIFKEYYSKLVRSIQDASPKTKIILQSILPISKYKEENTANVSISKIDTANKWISEIAEELSVRYLDTATALKDSKGYLASDYDSGDGLHLNREGYSKVLEYIRTHGYK
jgi:hypothetical protein